MLNVASPVPLDASESVEDYLGTYARRYDLTTHSRFSAAWLDHSHVSQSELKVIESKAD